MKKYNYYLVEQVVTNSKQRIAYSLPDIIQNSSDIKALVDVIDSNNELKLMAISDISDPSYKNATASDMWDILDKTSIGMKLLSLYPKIRNYRISSVLVGGEPEMYKHSSSGSADLYKFDKFANRKLGVDSRDTMPSFKEYISNPEKYNPHEVEGTKFKEKSNL